ncbi:MAG: hypothetical protein KC492_40695, partial [Myxococcales bacterium]|nr:hypothetical protein [Myxococcales bacterium]
EQLSQRRDALRAEVSDLEPRTDQSLAPPSRDEGEPAPIEELPAPSSASDDDTADLPSTELDVVDEPTVEEEQ